MTTTVEGIRDILRQEIAERYEPGDMLPNERELAARFGVSRNTVRETMIHLEAFRLIEKTRRGARVRKADFDMMFAEITQFLDTSPRTFSDVLNFRRISETGAAPLMVCHVTDEILLRIREANRAIGRALTAAEAAEADYRFHMGLVEASGNSVLIHMYEVLAAPLRYYLEVGKSQKLNTDTAQTQHARIIDALAARDADALVAAMGAHFQHSGDVLADWLSKREGASVSLWPVQHARQSEHIAAP
ncbi:FCD domain-containing protein [Thioclava sp. GXIMD4216]|uniref:FadR/GntR family transcriptional regulator n=1 Tax=Thioclava sp. GXIMD4216 TaxID=3131929 RepID=UPI0030CA84E1